MKNLLTSGRILVVPVLLGCGALALAQSLGNPVAEAWIGRPLEVTVPARFASSDSRDECVHADVFYGDTRISPARVRATITGPDQQKRVRIQSEALVDEPIVTLTLRAGCGSNTVTRSYTVLPEMPSEAVIAAMTRPQAPGATAAPAPTAVTGAAPLGSTSRVPALTAGPLRDLRAAPELGHAAQAARAAPKPARAEPLGAASRLRVEPLEVEGRAALRSSSALSENGDAARRQTAALLWAAINADPQELMRSTAHLQKLENELAQLRFTAAQTRGEMASLRRRLDEAQPWYLAPWIAQVLAVLVLASAAAAGVLAYRSRTRPAEQPWQEPATARANALWDPAFDGAVAEEVAAPLPVQRRSVERPAVPQPVARPVQVEPAVAGATARVAAAQTPARPATVDFDLAPSQPQPQQQRRAASGLLRVETLAATFEEVEFLVSLSLEDDAMDVLKTYLEDSTSPSPVAYYELMRLCAQEDAATVEAVRRRYAQVFGVEAPRLEQVTAPLGLETNRQLSERITRAWGTPEALQIIEQALFDVPVAGAALTLQAGRDLICLYDVAMTLVTEGEAAPATEAHPLAPWAHAEDSHAAHDAAKAAADAVGGHHFALDVDLSAAPEKLPERSADPGVEELAAARLQAEREAAREAFARRMAEEEDAFSAAMATERVPAGRY